MPLSIFSWSNIVKCNRNDKENNIFFFIFSDGFSILYTHLKSTKLIVSTIYYTIKSGNSILYFLLSKMADSDTEQENVETTPANDVVVTKYKMGGDIVNGIVYLVIHLYVV